MIKYIIILLCLFGCTKKHPTKDIKQAKPARIDTLKEFTTPLTILLILLASISNAQERFFMRKATSTTPIYDSITIQFRATNTTPATGVKAVLYGHPHLAIRSYTDPDYSITVNTGSTAAWTNISNLTANDAVPGATGGNALPGVGSSAYQSIMFNYANYNYTFDTTKYQLEISGLDPSKPYTITMTGSDGTLGFDCVTGYRVGGGTIVSGGSSQLNKIDINGDVASQSNAAVFVLYPSAAGVIRVYVIPGSASKDLGAISVLKIKLQIN